MRRHMPRETRDVATTAAASTKAPERRRYERRSLAKRIPTRYVVVLGAGSVVRAELLDESDVGIGVRLASVNRRAKIGDHLEVIYQDQRRRAEIRHLSETPQGYVIGLQWLPAKG